MRGKYVNKAIYLLDDVIKRVIGVLGLDLLLDQPAAGEAGGVSLPRVALPYRREPGRTPTDSTREQDGFTSQALAWARGFIEVP